MPYRNQETTWYVLAFGNLLAQFVRARGCILKELRKILAGATSDEIAGLSTVLKCDRDADSIISAIQDSSVNIWNRAFDGPPSYKRVLAKVADHVDVRSTGVDEKELEISIMQKLWGDVWHNLNPEQRELFNRELRRRAEKETGGSIAKIAITGGGMLAANLGGFATYALASSVVGAVTGAIGVTLPFVAYMGMSTAIATAIGPVGWLALGLLVIWRFGRADLEKITAAVCVISMIRARQDLKVSPESSWYWERMLAPFAVCFIILLTAIVLWWAQQP